MEVTRREKIRMSLYEYYWGQNWWLSLLRLLAGPLLILIGIFLVQVGDNVSVAYGGFSVGYGIYYTLKPFLRIALRLDYYKTAPLKVGLADDKIRFESPEGYSELSLDTFSKILARKDYFAFRMKRVTAICIPFKILSEEQQEKLNALTQK